MHFVDRMRDALIELSFEVSLEELLDDANRQALFDNLAFAGTSTTRKRLIEVRERALTKSEKTQFQEAKDKE